MTKTEDGEATIILQNSRHNFGCVGVSTTLASSSVINHNKKPAAPPLGATAAGGPGGDGRRGGKPALRRSSSTATSGGGGGDRIPQQCAMEQAQQPPATTAAEMVDWTRPQKQQSRPRPIRQRSALVKHDSVCVDDLDAGASAPIYTKVFCMANAWYTRGFYQF